jgi:hypothetical protein
LNFINSAIFKEDLISRHYSWKQGWADKSPANLFKGTQLCSLLIQNSLLRKLKKNLWYFFDEKKLITIAKPFGNSTD